MKQNVIAGTDIILITTSRSLMTLKLKKKSGSCEKNKLSKRRPWIVKQRKKLKRQQVVKVLQILYPVVVLTHRKMEEKQIQKTKIKKRLQLETLGRGKIYQNISGIWIPILRITSQSHAL